MLDILTPEQEELMHATREEWLAKFFSLQRIDKAKCEEGIKWLYELAGLPAPVVVFVSSPLAAQHMANLVSMKPEDEMQYFPFSYYGNVSDYIWVSFFSFFEKIGIVDLPEFTRFREFLDSNIYDCVQLEEFCIVCENPVFIHRENTKMHSTAGPAIKWADGYQLHFLHGVFFEETEWAAIVGGTIPAIDILKIENMEKRFAALKTIGAATLLTELNAKLIDTSERGNELWQIDNILSVPLKLLKYKCPSTGREYVKIVPTEIPSADEGQAWSFQLTADEYAQLIHES